MKRALLLALLIGLGGCVDVENPTPPGGTNWPATIEASLLQDVPIAITAACEALTVADDGFKAWVQVKQTQAGAKGGTFTMLSTVAQAQALGNTAQLTAGPICAANDAGTLVGNPSSALAAIKNAFNAYLNAIGVAQGSVP